MDLKEAPCADPDCTELGKQKCSGCSSVTYCSQACQKKHWPLHKTICKASSKEKSSSPKAVTVKPAQPVTSSVADIVAKLQDVKNETQKAFQAQNFPLSITHGLEALALAKQLPPLQGAGEIIQLHLNLASAYMHTQNVKEAENHSNYAVKEAEDSCSRNPTNPQLVEVLTIALGSRAFTFLNIGVHLDQAHDSALNSLRLAESIYPKNDSRLHKCLRALALVNEKQGNIVEAEKNFLKGYTLLCLAHGPHIRDAQMILDDLMGMCLRRNDVASAEKHANKNYQSLKDKTDDKEVVVLADSAARLGNVLRRQGREAEAEELLEQALAIREKFVSAIGPMGVAFTLIQLAQCQEAQGKYGDELEAKLMRALDIFGRVNGQQSPEVMNTLQSLRNVRLKRKERESAEERKNRVEELGEEDEGVVTSESKPASAGMTSSSSSSRLNAQNSVPVDDPTKLEFADDDAMGRMMAANTFFERQMYSYAEKMIFEAYTIFMRQNGPDHPSTQAAKQNLGVVRNNSLNQLWMQVVAEEVMRIEEESYQASLKNSKDFNICFLLSYHFIVLYRLR
jgi:tetratricopeptide (TPR) repeat protein